MFIFISYLAIEIKILFCLFHQSKNTPFPDHMKMRMIQKANVIQERFTQETQELERRQSLYNKKQSHNNNKSEEEEYVNFCQDSTFRIHILEKRLAEHKKTGTNRYNILEQRIANDPRLAALYSQDSY